MVLELKKCSFYHFLLLPITFALNQFDTNENQSI